MPKTVFVCHAQADASSAAGLASFLKDSLGMVPYLEEGRLEPGESIAEKLGDGLMADAILGLLSPASSPKPWRREQWEGWFREAEAERIPLGLALLEDCPYPATLAHNRLFDFRDGRRDGFRAIRRWLLRPMFEMPRFEAGRGASPVNRQVLDTLFSQVVDQVGGASISGPAGAGKTALAVALARECVSDYEALFWASGKNRWPESVAGELAWQCGLDLRGSLEANRAGLAQFVSRRRCLLVLDEADGAADFCGGLTSVVSIGADAPSDWPRISLPPAAWAAPQLEPAERELFAAASACAPAGFRIEIAVELATVDREVAARLIDRGLLIETDRLWQRCVVPSPLRTRPDDAMARAHATSMAARFLYWSQQPDECAIDLAGMEHALRWALAAPDSWDLARDLGRRAIAYLRQHARLAEVLRYAEVLGAAAAARGDRQLHHDCAWEANWIREQWDAASPIIVARQRMPGPEAQLAFFFGDDDLPGTLLDLPS